MMKRICYILVALVAAAACNKTEMTTKEVSADDIQFDAASYMNSTKSDPEPSSPALGTDVHFGVSANLNYDSGSYIYFQNQEVKCTDGVWAGVNSLKWPKGPDGYSLDFWACAPYSETPWCKVEDGKLKSNGAIEAATIDPADDDYDLLYSDWTRGATKSGGPVPMLFHHALAAVNVGLYINSSNDAVIFDADGRYTYEEWAETDSQWSTTDESYTVPIGSHPNDLEGIVLKKGTRLSGAIVVLDPSDHSRTITLDKDFELDQDYIQYQKFGHKLKEPIRNIWIVSLNECRLENVAKEGTLVMAPDAYGKTWTLPDNSVWTVPSEGEEGLAAHNGEIVFFEGEDVDFSPNRLNRVHTFPRELHIIPQDLHWSPLTPANNQKLHIKMHVRQFNYMEQSVNDKFDKNDGGKSTGNGACFDYRDIYQYETNDDGSFKAYKTRTAEFANGVSYTSMVRREKVWRETSDGTGWEEVDLKPTYEYDVEKEILLYDNSNFASAAPQYWKMNTRTSYVIRINFAERIIEFSPSVQTFAETSVDKW